MRIRREISDPICSGLSWDERWSSADDGLVASWERGREMRSQNSALAAQAEAGQLVPLPWRGGVDKVIKAGRKYGALQYLAMWKGLRGDPLDLDPAAEVSLTCTATGMVVVYTSDRSKWFRDSDESEGQMGE